MVELSRLFCGVAGRVAPLLSTYCIGMSLSAAVTTRVVDKAQGPYTTIQAAVDASSVGDVIYIRNGIYDSGSKSDGFGTPMMNRVVVDKSLTLVGESKENTIIKGKHASSPNDGKGLGLGDDAERCIAIKADNVVISNLTITGGATHNTQDGNDKEENNAGGVYVPNGRKGIVIVDCIVSNNAARRAAQIRHGNDGAANHENCLIVRTWIDGGKALNRDPAIRGCLAAHCLFTRHFTTGSIEYSATYVNCTFADGNCHHHGDTESNRVYGYNCIFADTWHKDTGKGNWFNCSFNKEDAETSSSTNEVCVFNPGYDLFMAPPLNNYRIHNGATAVIGKGNSSFLEKIPESYRYVDFYGHSFEQSSVNLGCSQEVITPTGGKVAIDRRRGVSKITSVDHHGATLDCGLYRFNGNAVYASYYLGYVRTMAGMPELIISNDASVATDASCKKGLHSFDASGADLMRRYPSKDGDFTVFAPAAGNTLSLSPNFNSSVLYVSRYASSQSPDGSAAKPYASLKDAVSAAQTAGGFATIHVGEGTYDNETMELYESIIGTGSSFKLKARVVIPSNVSVNGAGAGKSFIEGKADLENGKESHGCGPEAIRCVAIKNGARLSGFTLTGGCTDVGSEVDDAVGGGVLAQSGTEDTMALISDCIISNCVATRGGGAYNGVYNRCQFLDNRGINNGAAGRGRFRGYFYLYNCIVDRCIGWATTYFVDCMNCTFGEGNSDNLAAKDAQSICNTLILGDKQLSGAKYVGSCVMSVATWENLVNPDNGNTYNDTCVGTDVVAVAADLSPAIGSNPAVDAADTAIYNPERHGTKDVYGNERFVNGRQLDIGAVETSYLEAYAALLGRQVVVSAADPEVVADASGVVVPPGGSIAFSVGRLGVASRSYELVATVNGATCSIMQDGAPAGSLSGGRNVLTLKTSVTGVSDFVLAADGIGSTTINSLVARNGFAVTVR